MGCQLLHRKRNPPSLRKRKRRRRQPQNEEPKLQIWGLPEVSGLFADSCATDLLQVSITGRPCIPPCCLRLASPYVPDRGRPGCISKDYVQAKVQAQL